jgi:hypothetical protein
MAVVAHVVFHIGAFAKDKWGKHRDMYLDNAIIAIPAGGSFMWKDGWVATPCKEISPILLRYSGIPHTVLPASYDTAMYDMAAC